MLTIAALLDQLYLRHLFLTLIFGCLLIAQPPENYLEKYVLVLLSALLTTLFLFCSFLSQKAEPMAIAESCRLAESLSAGLCSPNKTSHISVPSTSAERLDLDKRPTKETLKSQTLARTVPGTSDHSHCHQITEKAPWIHWQEVSGSFRNISQWVRMILSNFYWITQSGVCQTLPETCIHKQSVSCHTNELTTISLWRQPQQRTVKLSAPI